MLNARYGRAGLLTLFPICVLLIVYYSLYSHRYTSYATYDYDYDHQNENPIQEKTLPLLF